MKKIFHSTLKPLVLAFIIAAGTSYAYAIWATPTATPPGGNIATPVNTGNVGQQKDGNLVLNFGGANTYGLTVVGRAQVDSLVLTPLSANPTNPAQGQMWLCTGGSC